jgi:UDP-xylose:glucoside alpha-1,3-xylosyltransferase
MYGSVCAASEDFGVRVFHGSRGYYHNDKQPAFKAVYQTLKKVHITIKT